MLTPLQHMSTCVHVCRTHTQTNAYANTHTRAHTHTLKNRHTRTRAHRQTHTHKYEPSPRALASHEWFSPASTACVDAGGRRVVVYIYLCAHLRGFDEIIRSRRKETARTQWLSTYL